VAGLRKKNQAMIVQLYRRVGDVSRLPFKVVVLVFLMAWLTMCTITFTAYDTFNTASVPDIYFGYSSKELYAMYEAWGEEGRKVYIRLAMGDLFLFIPAYTILFGAILINVLGKPGFTENLAWITIFSALCDYAETSVQAFGCIIFPEHLSDVSYAVGSIANQLKWVSLSVSGALLLIAGALQHGKKMHKKA